MNKVDCVTEAMQESYEAGVEKGGHEIIKRFIAHGFSLETVSKGSGLSVTEIENLLKEGK